MICYRDMTFCNRGHDCTCSGGRRLTEDVRRKAALAGLPLSQADLCHGRENLEFLDPEPDEDSTIPNLSELPSDASDWAGDSPPSAPDWSGGGGGGFDGGGATGDF